MAKHESLSDVLERLKESNLRRRQLSYGQMEELSGVPKSTIVKWFEGTTSKPRDWRRLIKLAVALELNHSEVNDLLTAANHPDLDELRRGTKSAQDRELLAPWPLLEPPFRAENTLDYFTDRETKLAELTGLLTAAQPPALVSIEGMAGIGKTEIATCLAHMLRDHFADGVLWVDMENLDPLSELGELATDLRFDLSRYREVPGRSRAFKEILSKKQVLLILDGATGDQEVEPFVPPANSPSVVIVTTRHQGLWATRRAHSVNIDDFTDDDALELYKKVLGENRVASESQALKTLSHSVGHLPIALDITAHLLKKNSNWAVVDFLNRIESSEDRMARLRMGTDQNVAHLFETGYDQLTRSQQQFFATLGIFAGSDFSSVAVAFVCQTSEPRAEDLLISLTDISLLKETAKGRYRLHTLLRDFARLKEPIAGAEERMVRFYVDYTHEHQSNYSDIAREIDNIRAALDNAARRGMDQALVIGTNALYKYLEANGLHIEAQTRLENALIAAQRSLDPSAQARTLIHLADLQRIGGNLKNTESLLQDAMALADESQDAEVFCGIHQGMGVLRAFQKDLSGAEFELQRALSVARDNHYDLSVCALLINLSSVKLYQRDRPAVVNLLAESLELAREIEAWDLAARSVSNLASLEAGQGNMAKANDYLKQGLDFARHSGHRATIINLSANLAASDIELGDYHSAAAHLLEALLQARDLGDVEALSRVMRNYGELYSKTRNYTAADDHFGNALQLARSARHELLTLTTLADWGKQLLVRGDRKRAELYFDEVIVTGNTDDFPEFMGIAKFGLAQIREYQGKIEEACQLAREALALFEQIGDPAAADVTAFLTRLRCPDIDGNQEIKDFPD